MSEPAPSSAQDHWRSDAADCARRADRAAHSALQGVLLRAYGVPRLRVLVIRIVRRLEGGPIYSATLREILRRYHDADVGRYSYGAILQPGVLPPGSRVGNYCSVGTQLIVRRRDHPIDRPFQHAAFYNSNLGFLRKDTIPAEAENPLQIGHDVWVGDRATILSGCRQIGNGAVIAAGAVVTRDVAPYTIVGGVPARALRKRFPDEHIKRLESTCWWERPLAEVIAARDLPNPFTPFDFPDRMMS